MIEFVRLNLQAARDAVAPVLGNPKIDTTDGLSGPDDVIGGGVAFEVRDAGGPLAVVILCQLQYQQGRVLEIRFARELAAAGDLTERVLPEIERRYAAGYDAVTIYTRRPGLVRKLEAQGYSQAAVIMRKAMP
jgi:hypothetical protein